MQFKNKIKFFYLKKLSDSILLVLHLELRFHCFFHLLPITINQNSSTIFTQQEEMDKDVMEFGRDLTITFNFTIKS